MKKKLHHIKRKFLDFQVNTLAAGLGPKLELFHYNRMLNEGVDPDLAADQIIGLWKVLIDLSEDGHDFPEDDLERLFVQLPLPDPIQAFDCFEGTPPSVGDT